MTFRGWSVEAVDSCGTTVLSVHCPDGHEVPSDGAGCPWCWKRTPARIVAEIDRLVDEGAVG